MFDSMSLILQKWSKIIIPKIQDHAHKTHYSIATLAYFAYVIHGLPCSYNYIVIISGSSLQASFLSPCLVLF